MELLELIAKKCHVGYISDLKILVNWKEAVSEIPSADFSLKEWQETVQYLCSAEQVFPSAEQAKKYLIAWKKNNKQK